MYAAFYILSFDCRLLTDHTLPNTNTLLWVLAIKIKLIFQLLFLWLYKKFILASDII